MPEAPSPLELDGERRRRLLALAAELIEEHTAGVARLPVAPRVTPDALRARLARYDFAAPVEPEALLRDAADLLGRFTVHTGSPRYFGLFNPAPAFAGVLGDALVAAFNPQLAVWSHAPAAQEIERHLLAFVGARLGLPAGTLAGSFTSGGAEANATGVLLALTRAFPEVAEGGLRALPGQPLLYASEQSHLALLKIAHGAGLGRRAVRLVPTDDQLRLDPARLAAAIAADRAAGQLPFLVVATAGTTAAGMIDPLPAVADVCAETGLRLHVDAAWAGAVALSDALRPLLAGIERADSVTVDAHKWLSAPMAAGMFLCTDPEGLAETFRVSTAYMPAGTAGTVDPYVHGLQWSRRFIGLKLFLALAAAGREGYARQLERDCRLGELLRERLVAAGWRLENATPLPVVCFSDRRPGTDHQAVAARVVASGEAWLSTVSLRGRTVLRACITNFRTTAADVEALVASLAAAR